MAAFAFGVISDVQYADAQDKENPVYCMMIEALCDTSIGAVVNDMQESYKKGHFGELRDDDRKLYEAEWGGMVEPTTPSATFF